MSYAPVLGGGKLVASTPCRPSCSRRRAMACDPAPCTALLLPCSTLLPGPSMTHSSLYNCQDRASASRVMWRRPSIPWPLRATPTLWQPDREGWCWGACVQAKHKV